MSKPQVWNQDSDHYKDITPGDQIVNKIDYSAVADSIAKSVSDEHEQKEMLKDVANSSLRGEGFMITEDGIGSENIDRGFAVFSGYLALKIMRLLFFPFRVKRDGNTKFLYLVLNALIGLISASFWSIAVVAVVRAIRG